MADTKGDNSLYFESGNAVKSDSERCSISAAIERKGRKPIPTINHAGNSKSGRLNTVDDNKKLTPDMVSIHSSSTS